MKSVIMFFTIVFSAIGSFFPMLFGNNDIFSLWSILSGFVFGIVGVWFGVVFSRRFL